ncbi:MAG TPA: DUF1801 domain-containing protein [Candidatus Limnocylindria bacterium]|nr:DUF1801 domain-containing protein [Candidatus Limnocylindria bacterium]
MTPVEQYIQSCPEEHRAKLSRLRDVILEAVPGLAEKIAYGIPTFYKAKNVIHFSLAKAHIGIYPGPDAVAHFAPRLAGYRTDKGTVRIPLDAPLPEDLIRDLARWSAERLGVAGNGGSGR